MMAEELENNLSRCNHCIMTEATPGIGFDHDHVCNYCRDFKNIEPKGESALLQILENAGSNRGRYDCIVNISGGRDSSFTILKMVKDYGLKVLAVNYANPFTHELAADNIQKITRILKVKLVSFSFSEGFHQKIVRANLLALAKKPDPAMVPMVCISCKLIWKNILDIANAHKIGLIVSGGNLYEQTVFKRALLGGRADQSVSEYYTNYVFGLVKHAARNYRFLRPQTLIPTVKGYFYSNPYSPMVRWKGRHIDKVDLFHYLPWNENLVINRISDELNWRSPDDNSGSWRFDCRIGHLKDYLYLKLLGITEKDDFYSQLIRDGKISRDEAIKRVEQENRVNMNELEQLMKSINLDIGILDSIKPQ